MESEEETQFKKPDIVISKVIKPHKNVRQDAATEESPVEDPETDKNESHNAAKSESTAKLFYEEPPWSSLPKSTSSDYTLEVLKNGSIIDNINLMKKQHWLFGRLIDCDVCMQHPTVSRHHAILQYRGESDANNDKGFYVYDLGSTHGTFLNKSRLKPKIYARIRVGHMLKLGCSTRTYILNGPQEDAEEESTLSVTELKEERARELKKREEEKQALIEAEKRKEERGIDWGLGEDADEESDLSENPYAQTNNEDLYIDDPKKTLRGFFEREGLDLEYDCSEQGIGQFLCKVELPIDDELGKPIFAEVIHKGKKKEAVVQCALEACRILDRHGLLRQAVHESHKRKPKNWEENDYYDSDDDTFLDRTGTVEKKRLMRMNKAKPVQSVETYESLLAKEKDITNSVNDLEKQLTEAENKLKSDSSDKNTDVDSLDQFMEELKESKPDKQAVNKLKADLNKLKQEHIKVVKLINIAKPASLPPLVSNYNEEPGTSSSNSSTNRKSLPIFGKRKKIKLQLPEKPETTNSMDVEEPEDDIQSDSNPVNSRVSEENADQVASSETENSADEEKMTLEKFEKILENLKLPTLEGKNRDKIAKIVHNLKKLAFQGDRMHAEWKTLEAKKRKIMKLVSYIESSERDPKLEFRVASEMNKILNELNAMTDQKLKVINKIKKMGSELNTISDEIDSRVKETNKLKVAKKTGETPSTSYSELEGEENYSMWVPPENQSGDGRTKLNEKYGY